MNGHSKTFVMVQKRTVYNAIKYHEHESMQSLDFMSETHNVEPKACAYVLYIFAYNKK